PGNRYMGGGIRTMVDNVSAEARTNVTISGLGTITQYQPAGRCKVLTSYDYSQVRLAARGESLPIPNPQHFIGATASFGDMTGVQVIGSVVYLSWKGNTHRSEIYLGSESLANRVGFAFEFLRMNCDPAAATGF
ncbi:MAG TPA: hypothetical protein VEA15_05910, partial [Caulobacteraceae bacterium]|nr:hypothetical protein [Caulobacteraceae bacterium]